MDPNRIPTISNAQMLAAARLNYFRAMEAQSLGKGDRHLLRADLTKLQAAIDYWQEKVDADNGQTSEGGVAYASFFNRS
jgi:hypothetical protein